MAQSVLPEIFETSGEFQIRTLPDFCRIVLGKIICVNLRNLRMLPAFNPWLKNFSGLYEMDEAESNR
jgi:hypothetical protein